MGMYRGAQRITEVTLRSWQAVGTRRLRQHRAVTGALALALCLLMLSGAGGRAQANPAAQEFVPRQILVELQATTAGTSNETIKKINKKYGTTPQGNFEGGTDVYLLELPATAPDVSGTAKKIETDEKGVLNAEPNYRMQLPEGAARFRAFGVSDLEPSPEEYAASELNLVDAHGTTKGRGSVVAVIDTGVQLSHPKLSGSLTDARYDFVDDDKDPTDKTNGQDNDGDGLVDEKMFGHGTHVAGLVHFVAPEAKIMPLRALYPEGHGDAFHIAQAIDYAKDNGANVINLSLGASSRSQVLRTMINDATKKNANYKGVLVTAAAGNMNTSAPEFPAADNGSKASTEGLVAVTAVNVSGQKSSWANYGDWVDIAAPGENLRSAYPGDKYAAWSGTSMATALVSGQAALIRANDDSLGPAGVEEKIRCSARPLDEGAPDYAGLLGAGYTNVGASLAQDACPPKKK
jgi:thermitase